MLIMSLLESLVLILVVVVIIQYSFEKMLNFLKIYKVRKEIKSKGVLDDCWHEYQKAIVVIINSNKRPFITVDVTKKGVLFPGQQIKDDFIKLDINPEAINNFKWHKNGFEFKTKFSGEIENIFIPMDSIKYLDEEEKI